MRTKLISIETDTLPLDGTLHLPERGPVGAVMLSHRNTMNFSVSAAGADPARLPCLAFNRRGHDIPSIRGPRGCHLGHRLALACSDAEDER